MLFRSGPLWSGSTVSAPYGNNRVDGVGTYFNFLNVGSMVEFEGQANTWYVTSIQSNTTMFVSNTVPTAVSAKKIFKAYKNGHILNLTGKGVTAGGQRTVTMGASNTSFTIDIKETWPATEGATVTYKVAKRNAAEATKALNPNRFVKIDC